MYAKYPAMDAIYYYSTNNPDEKVNFETALLKGMASNYGLYMAARRDIPLIPREQIRQMRGISYAEIAYQVLYPFLGQEIPSDKLKALLNDAYREEQDPRGSST